MKLSEAKKPIGAVLGIAISVLLGISGILLCISCLSIYRSAETNMFTYEKIGEAFSKIAVPIFITLAAIVLGIAFICFERLSDTDSKEKIKPHKNPKAALAALVKRTDMSNAKEEEKAKVAKERDLRRTLKTVNITLCTLSALLPPIYLLNPVLYLGTTSAEVSGEVLYCLLFYIVCLLPLTVFNLLYTVLSNHSIERESAILKSIIKNNTNSKAEKSAEYSETPNTTKKKKPLLLCLKIAIFATAFVLIILGIANEGMQDVWKKGAEICAECIGLG